MSKRKNGNYELAPDKWDKQSPHCRESHKPFKLLNGELFGYRAGHPKDGFDIYVGLDYGMALNHQKYPWQKNEDNVIEIQFKVTDGSAPKDKKEFKNMVVWLVEQLEAGKRIHIGCIGGHGRTGMLMAAIVATAIPEEKDPIGWVRKQHCKKAVESESQVKFLMKDYGAKKAKPSKPRLPHYKYETNYWKGESASDRKKRLLESPLPPLSEETVRHVPMQGNIWTAD